MEYYRDHGYITARVGTPELTVVRDSADTHTRFVELRIPVVEGRRYTIGAFTFAGNAFIKNDALRLMFKVQRGTYYSDMRLQEGKQYFVNRLTLTESTTRESLVRREVRLVDGGVFNTEALKYSIKRLNELGYFKPIEGYKNVDVSKTPGEDNKVDVNLKLEDR